VKITLNQNRLDDNRSKNQNKDKKQTRHQIGIGDPEVLFVTLSSF